MHFQFGDKATWVQMAVELSPVQFWHQSQAKKPIVERQEKAVQPRQLRSCRRGSCGR